MNLLVTVYHVQLVSIKKLKHADITVGVLPTSELAAEAVVIPCQVDPNESHPYLQRDIVYKLKDSIPGFYLPLFPIYCMEVRLAQ